jgi:hypothetical protein
MRWSSRQVSARAAREFAPEDHMMARDALRVVGYLPG